MRNFAKQNSAKRNSAKRKVFKDRVFYSSILISLAVHLFWLSAIKVVAVMKETRPIKFSKVSFLGPIPERGVLEVGIGPRERTFLEERVFEKSHTLITISASRPQGLDRQAEDVNDHMLHDKKLTGFIENALDSSKLQPI